MLHHYPTPDAEGLAKTKELYLNQCSRELTDEEAYEVLSQVMRFLYLINPAYPGYNPLSHPINDQPCSTTPSMPENPTKTKN